MSKNILKPIAVFSIMIFIAISYFCIIGEELIRDHSKQTEENPQIATIYKADPANDTSYDSIILANMESHKNLTYEFPNEPSYILRLDDVQSLAWSDVSMQIINDTLSRNMSITIAIIPTRSNYDSSGIIKYINTQKDNPHLEIAQHGCNHIYYEYDNLSVEKVEPTTMQGLRCLYRDYNVTPVTFIPPNNHIASENNTTVNILNDMGFKILSTTGNVRDEGDMVNVGQTIATIDGTVLNSPERIMEKCEWDFENQNLSVIMIHPQDYVGDDRKTLDPEKYSTYLELLNELNNTEAQSITFRDLLK